MFCIPSPTFYLTDYTAMLDTVMSGCFEDYVSNLGKVVLCIFLENL